MHDILSSITDALVALSFVEILATLFGLWCVWLTVRANVWCWPTGIVSVIAFAILFFQQRLYADMALQGFFLVSSLLGWYYWLYGGHQHHGLNITRLTRQQWILIVLSNFLLVLLSGYLLQHYTDDALPYLDSMITILSITAQLLLTRKKIDSWLFWIVVDVISIGVYFHREIYLTTLLYVVFLVLATRGYFVWRRQNLSL